MEAIASNATVAHVRASLVAGDLSCEQVVRNFLSRIKTHDHLNAFLEVFSEEAIKKAISLDKRIKKNQTVGKLAGSVVGIKDNLCLKGHRVTASSKILEKFESLYTATAVQRLVDEDAIIIGRLNCDEFGMGSSNENSAYGKVLNPHNNEYVPGGSSGGAAAAVAAGLCNLALGTDTGGSIRQPASFCGVVGLKPTYGRVSRHGCIAYASSFDQIGPITNSVDDASIVLEVIAGKDKHDSTSSSIPVSEYSKEIASSKLKLAFINDCIKKKGIDQEISLGLNSLLKCIKKAGNEVQGVNFPYLEYVVPAYYILTTAEASSNLSRYCGVLYGHRSKDTAKIEEVFTKSRSEGFGDEVKRRIMLGAFVLSAGFYDEYYAKAQKVRRLVKDYFDELFKHYQFVLLPSTPGTAFKFSQRSDDPVSMYLEDIFTVQASLAGLPSISLPVGKTTTGLPYGLQVVGNKFDEHALFGFAKQIMDNLPKGENS